MLETVAFNRIVVEEKGPDRIIRPLNESKTKNLCVPGTASRFVNCERFARAKRWQRSFRSEVNRRARLARLESRLLGLPGMGHHAHQSGSEPMPLEISHPEDVSKMRVLFSEEFFQRFHMAYRNYEAQFIVDLSTLLRLKSVMSP